ncbi:MAG: fumarylacetoacetate hydrolase family protein [Actinomycetes bacterium]
MYNLKVKLAALKTQKHSHQLVILDRGVHYAIPGILSLTDLHQLRISEIKDRLVQRGEIVTGEPVAPISPEIELWGAGVTYLRSRDARKEESGVPDVYQRVYEADRPELFFKSTASRTNTTDQAIGIRYDSPASVPEPEIAIYINRYQEIIGYSICNDVTARSIEGDNPLYLSQAKIYLGSTSLGPDITPSWLVPPAARMTISAQIIRLGVQVWQAQTSLGALNRTLDDLVSYLFRCQSFPYGAILSTGTGIVPSIDVSLQEGDIVEISVEGLGVLSNKVVVIPQEPQ